MTTLPEKGMLIFGMGRQSHLCFNKCEQNENSQFDL